MKQPEKLTELETLNQVIKEAKHLLPETRQKLLSFVQYLPRAKRTIQPEEEKEWLDFHAHKDKNFGAIGGHITKTECYTSIGTIQTWKCSSCGEEAFVDEDF